MIFVLLLLLSSLFGFFAFPTDKSHVFPIKELPSVAQLGAISYMSLEDLSAFSKTSKEATAILQDYFMVLKKENFYLVESALFGAIEAQYNHLAKSILHILPETEVSAVFYDACATGNEQFVSFLLPRIGFPIFFDGYSEAAFSGHIEVVGLLIDEFNRRMASFQVHNEPDEVFYPMIMEYLKENSFVGNQQVFDIVAHPPANLRELLEKTQEISVNAAFLVSTARGHVEMVKFFVGKAPLVDASFARNQALRGAAANGKLEVVLYLLGLDSTHGVDPAAEENEALVLAARNGYLGTIKALLSLGNFRGVDACVSDNLPYINAAAGGHLPILQFFEGLPANHKIVPVAQDSFAFGVAAEYGHLDVLEHLIRIKGMNPAGNQNYAFVNAAKNGHIKVLQFLLVLRERFGYRAIDPAMADNDAFIEAARYGRLKVLKYLISISERYGIQPYSASNLAFIVAAENGHLDTVQYLVSLRNQFPVEPSDQENLAIILACKSGHLNVVKYLVSLPPEIGVRVSARDNLAFIQASKHGHFKIIEYLLSLSSESKVDPFAQSNQAMKMAVKYNYVDIAEKLVQLAKLEKNTHVLDSLDDLREFALERGFQEMYDMLDREDSSTRRILNFDDDQ